MRIGLIASVAHHLDAFFPSLVAQWERDGHDVFLAAGTASEIFDNAILPGLTRRPSLRNTLAHHQLNRWAKQERLEVIVSNTATASALARFPKLDVPVVYFCHGLHWNTGETWEDRVWMQIEQFLLRNTHAVLCMNSNDQSWFGSRLAAERVLYLDFGVGVPLEQYPVSPMPQGKKINLLWAGEFSHRKRPYLMLEVAKELCGMNFDFVLTMIGQGHLLDEMKIKASDLGLQEHVVFPGYSKLSEHMQHNHFLVHTALWEGLPRVMLEARAMCRQSVAFDVKGVRDIPGVVLVPNGDVVGFANRIKQVSQEFWVEGAVLSPPDIAMDSSSVGQLISGFLRSSLAGRVKGR